jgi:hypothetical protein
MNCPHCDRSSYQLKLRSAVRLSAVLFMSTWVIVFVILWLSLGL